MGARTPFAFRLMPLDLLTTNDRLGEYPDSYYAASTPPTPTYSALETDIDVDVCIIGGGFTGLSAALALAEAGRDVVLLEASRIGFGASGRNGGQLGIGQRIHQDQIEEAYGTETAHDLWRIGLAAKDSVLNLAKKHAIDIAFKPGIASAEFTAKDMHHAHAYAEKLRRDYGYDKIEPLDATAMRAQVNSPVYHGGILDHGAGHIHPLKFALGLAKAARVAGAQIHENSRVNALNNGAKTERGTVRAQHYVIACNGYLGDLAPQVARFVMPINNFIVATEPLGARAREIIPNDIAVADSKFVVNYFRLSDDGRLLFGGGESYGYRFPTDLKAKAYKPMIDIFPQLAGANIDYAWGGTLAITMNRLPYVKRLDDKTWTASGYSGHGVALATLCGQLIAADITSTPPLQRDFATLAALKHRSFPGGPRVRHPLLVLAMLWYQLRDKAGF